jgi:ABC-type sulfate transport system permease component
MDAISLDHPGLIGSALRNKALGILWAKQDHSVYRKRVSDLLNDVPMFVPIHFSSHIFLSIFDRNVKHFLEVIGILLQDLCARKCLGSVYMSLSYVVQDETDGIKGVM